MGKEGSSVEKITTAEYQRILSLPKRKFGIAGEERLGLYDETSGRFYLLNNDGSFSGKTAIVKKTQNKQPEIEGPSANKTDVDKQGSKNSKHPLLLNSKIKSVFKKKQHKDELQEDVSDAEHIDTKTSNKKKKMIFLSVSIVVLLVAVFALMPTFLGGHIFSHPLSDNENDPVIAGLETMSVVQIQRELLPGDVIMDSDIVIKEISAESYNIINLTGNALYQQEHFESIVGMCAVAYIPKGQYLQHNTIARTYKPINPWTVETENIKYVKIPIKNITTSVAGIVFGSVVDLSIDIKTVVRPHTVSPDETQLPAGMTYETSTRQSYVTDTYGLKAAVICDLLNEDVNSLFYDYAVFGAIPEAEQITYFSKINRDSEYGRRLLPTHIVIALTNSQAKTLGNLSGDNVTIKLTEIKNVSFENFEMSILHKNSKLLYQTLTERFVLED